MQAKIDSLIHALLDAHYCRFATYVLSKWHQSQRGVYDNNKKTYTEEVNKEIPVCMALVPWISTEIHRQIYDLIVDVMT